MLTLICFWQTGSGALPKEHALLIDPDLFLEKNGSLELQLNLIDGSRLIGTTQMAWLPVRTEIDSMAIPLEKIRNAERDGQKDSWLIHFNKGGQMSASLQLESLSVQTLLGPLEVKLKYMESLQVRSLSGLKIWRFQGNDLKDFEMQGEGSWNEIRGDAVVADFGMASRWHGPRARHSINFRGDFQLQAKVSSQSKGAELGRISIGVQLQDGEILQMRLQDGDANIIGYAMGLYSDEVPLKETNTQVARRTFQDHSLQMIRVAGRIRLLSGGKEILVAEDVSRAAVTAVFFSIEQYKGYDPLTQA